MWSCAMEFDFFVENLFLLLWGGWDFVVDLGVGFDFGG
jgi:hypothetical protein